MPQIANLDLVLVQLVHDILPEFDHFVHSLVSVPVMHVEHIRGLQADRRAHACSCALVRRAVFSVQMVAGDQVRGAVVICVEACWNVLLRVALRCYRLRGGLLSSELFVEPLASFHDVNSEIGLRLRFFDLIFFGFHFIQK